MEGSSSTPCFQQPIPMAQKRSWPGSEGAATTHHHVPLPSLPKLTTEIMLQVFTHASLRRSDSSSGGYYDNEMLVELGKSAFEAAITYVLFSKRPMLALPEIQQSRKKILSDTNMQDLVTMYGLRSKLRCHPDVLPELDSPKESRSLLYAYLGGIYAERGIEHIQTWMKELLEEPNIQHVKSPKPRIQHAETPPLKKIKAEWTNSQGPAILESSAHARAQTPPQSATKTASQPNPLAPAQPHLPFLPLFNQTAAQRRVAVEYPSEFAGPSHAGQWTVRCIVNGIFKGVGTGTSKQIAKEEAARQAYYAMGWT